MSHQLTQDLIQNIVSLLATAQQKVMRAINQSMVIIYFEIGRLIVEHEQNGKARAEYGKSVLSELSKQLISQFGKGFSQRNLEQMRQFYLVYSIPQTVSAEFKLSWSHYLKLMRIDDSNERSFYEIESHKNNWSLRELQRQYDSALYTRLTISLDQEKVVELSQKGQSITSAKDMVKDPYILEFLGLPEQASYSELELETQLIDKLSDFLLELGNGFTFVARQKRISIDEKHFRVDLVFYNRLLKSFVLIDLKIGELKHQDLGQMQMYVNYYDRFVRLDDENKTIGIILCRDKSETLVEITLPQGNDQIFASKYQTVLPSKETLMQLVNDAK
jgi:predicted nuclease of restriction endonuclease-like (RecB) superfamily